MTHCIETALIVEGLLSPTEEDERCGCLAPAAWLHVSFAVPAAP